MDVSDGVERLLTAEGRQDPYPTYDAIREHGPLAKVQDGFYVATGYSVIDEMLRDPRLRVSDRELFDLMAPGLHVGRAARSIGGSMLQNNPPDHTRMRRLAAGAFTPRRVAAMRDTVAEQASTLAGWLDRLGAGGEPVDFMAEFAYPLPVRVICALLGVPAGDQQWFREQASALTIVLEPLLRWESVTVADQAAVELEEYFTALIGERRRDPRDDLTSALVQAHDADGATLSGDELLANLILLLVAGFETTTNLLGNGLAVLFGEPDGLRAGPERFVEEVLRLDSPVQLTSRWSREPVSFAGVTVEPYAQILILLGAGNRDPARFVDPGRFQPTRDPQGPLSFGAGAHYCLGAALARMEAQVAFPLLLDRFPDLAPAGEPVRRDRLTLRGYVSLPVRL